MTYLIISAIILAGFFLFNTNALSNVFFDSIQSVIDLFSSKEKSQKYSR